MLGYPKWTISSQVSNRERFNDYPHMRSRIKRSEVASDLVIGRRYSLIYIVIYSSLKAY
nr:MAG TPA: Sulfakinin family [Caudoviricetes sp.]